MRATGEIFAALFLAFPYDFSFYLYFSRAQKCYLIFSDTLAK